MQSNLIKIYEITRTRTAITAHPRKIIGDFLSVTTIINTIHLSRRAGKKSFSDYTCDRFAPGISLAHFGGGNPDHLFRSAFPRGHAGSKSKRVYGSRTIQVKLVRGRAGERDGSQKGRRGSSSVAKDRGIELPTEFRLIQLAEEIKGDHRILPLPFLLCRTLATLVLLCSSSSSLHSRDLRPEILPTSKMINRSSNYFRLWRVWFFGEYGGQI